MASKVITIKIESNFLKLCEVSISAKKGITVHYAETLAIPEECFQNGMIQDIETIKTIVSEEIKRGKITSDDVIFTLPAARVATKEVVIPYMKEKQILEMIRTNGMDYFPVSNIEDYVLTFKTLETTEVEGVKQLRIFLIAVPYKVMEGYKKLAAELKLSIESFDFSGNSLFQFIKREKNENITADISIGVRFSIINIVNQDTLLLQRVIPYGMMNIIESVGEKFHISVNEAYDLLQEKYLIQDYFDADEITDSLRPLVSNISRIIDYYAPRYPELPIAKVVLSGGGSHFLGIENLFSTELGTRVLIGEYEENLDIQYKKVKGKIGAYMDTIGSVYDPVELEVKDSSKSKSKFKFLKKIWIVSPEKKKIRFFILSICFALGLLIVPLAGILFKKIEISRINARIEKVSEIENVINTYKNLQETNQVLEGYYSQTEHPNDKYYDFLLDLEKMKPTDMGIVSLESNEGAVTMSVNATKEKEIAEFIIQLKNLEYIQSVFATDVILTESDAGTYYTVDITCTIGAE